MAASSHPWMLPWLAVSITTSLCGLPNNTLVVRQNFRQVDNVTFTLCLDGVLKHGVSDVTWLVEWLELSRIQGAERIFVYNMSASRHLDQFLSLYETLGVLQVLPWSLPLETHENADEFTDDFLVLWNYGQDVMIHDCLYRNLGVSQYIVYTDLDEFIVPQQPHAFTWQHMIDATSSNCIQPIGDYVARASTFEMTANDNNGYPDLSTQAHTTSYESIRGPFHKSKYILKPEEVLHTKVHFVDEYYRDKVTSCVFPTYIGLLHHYKLLNNTVKTRTNNSVMLKYGDNLEKRVQNIRVKTIK